MAYSYVEYTASGSTNQFDITFDYIDRTYIKVYIDNVEDTTFTFVNDSRIQTTSTPTSGQIVKIDRDTPVTSRLVDFQDGSVLTESDLDRSANQNFHISQETVDEVASKLGQNNSGVYDALNKRIINVATPTAGTDATNKNYIDTQTNNAFTSATNAATSATAAAASATAAAASETAAAASETAAASSETAAASSETNAASSATSASTSAATATTKASEASTSASNASTSATNAASSATSASTSAATATTKASEASTSASNASTSETNAASSATSAATSATNAASSETNAASSATSASSSASTATTQASNASTSATNAAASETAAATSATNAAASETAAATSETNAATSETNAASSASTASTQATNASNSASAASTSATNAANSASAAATSAASAASAYDTFDDRYLGSKTSDPTLDNDGNALVTGALYFNSSANEMRVYDGGNWIPASSAGSASLILYEYTATSGQTTFSGTDDNSATLSYSVNNIIVTLNGITLDPSDYTATSGTSIVLGTGATTGDLLNVYAFKSFTVSELNANNLTDGTIPDARFPAVLPAISGANLTGIISDVVEDTTPQLGGSLDLNSNNITGTGNVNITGTVTATSFSGDGSSLTGITSTTINNNANNRVITGSATANTLEAESNLVYDGTNLGIGTTPSSWGGQFKAIDINSYATFSADNDTAFMTDNGYYNGTNWIYKNTNLATRYYQQAGNHVWSQASSGTSGNNITWSEAMRIDSSGNVGIGTSSPSSFNQYADNLVVGTTSGENGITIASGTANGGRIIFSDNTASPFRGAFEYDHSSDGLITYTNGTARTLLTSNGHFEPYATNTYDLGSSVKVWRNIYTSDFHMSNEGLDKGNDIDGTKGSWTFQEGEENLYLINNKNGKKYKFNLTEIE